MDEARHWDMPCLGMQDEAEHGAFGQMALKDSYAQLASAERAERADFMVEGCYLVRDRFRIQRCGRTRFPTAPSLCPVPSPMPPDGSSRSSPNGLLRKAVKWLLSVMEGSDPSGPHRHLRVHGEDPVA